MNKAEKPVTRSNSKMAAVMEAAKQRASPKAVALNTPVANIGETRPAESGVSPATKKNCIDANMDIDSVPTFPIIEENNSGGSSGDIDMKGLYHMMQSMSQKNDFMIENMVTKNDMSNLRNELRNEIQTVVKTEVESAMGPFECRLSHLENSGGASTPTSTKFDRNDPAHRQIEFKGFPFLMR